MIKDLGARQLVAALAEFKQLDSLELGMFDNQVSEKIKHRLKSQLLTAMHLTKFLNYNNELGCEGGCWFDESH